MKFFAAATILLASAAAAPIESTIEKRDEYPGPYGNGFNGINQGGNYGFNGFHKGGNYHGFHPYNPLAGVCPTVGPHNNPQCCPVGAWGNGHNGWGNGNGWAGNQGCVGRPATGYCPGSTVPRCCYVPYPGQVHSCSHSFH
ncbi:hypothetical protein HRG_006464 [Hirsutella rhossiliensis]|uniref:Uncharacterized protein n=1 Tax=Hirsutella rhossiliensis TaxID=111463 RepID=A0A9P8MWK9_9HYPO|nr:uncharacterized protein HRG_06464 [Hirsutella rhossiliensis]KAH0962362.1 hypothetical protein HRG_06464 [Hirsutella rhossiliensis]